MKFSLTLPFCFFPTTICLLDDHAPFLNHLSMCLKPGFFFIKHTSPLQALDALYAAYHATRQRPSLHDCRVWIPDDELDAESNTGFFYDLNLSRIHEKIFDPHRFEEISVVVVDYNMPEMDGIAFCERIRDLPVKKIMLTGEMDLSLAVDAFNAGIIDRFIQKNSPLLFEALDQTISRLQWEYFTDQSRLVVPDLRVLRDFTWNHPACREALETYYHTIHAAEFYLLDHSGSALLADWSGYPYWFLIKSETELKQFEQIAIDQQAPAAMIQALSTRSMLPFFLHPSDHKKPAAEWMNMLFPAKPIKNQEGHPIAYYSKITGELENRPLKKPIWSHQSQNGALASDAKSQAQH